MVVHHKNVVTSNIIKVMHEALSCVNIAYYHIFALQNHFNALLDLTVTPTIYIRSNKTQPNVIRIMLIRLLLIIIAILAL